MIAFNALVLLTQKKGSKKTVTKGNMKESEKRERKKEGKKRQVNETLND